MKRDRHIQNIADIIKYSKMSVQRLRKLNKENGRLYNGKELTKYQLIYQLTYLMDA